MSQEGPAGSDPCPEHRRQELSSFCHSQLMLTGMQRATWQKWSFSQPHQGKRINRYQTLSKGSCAKTIKYSCTAHPIWQDHTTEKGINTAPKHPRGSHFSPSATASSPAPVCWTEVALWKTFQACLDDQRDRKTGVHLSSSPSPVPCTPTCTPADLQSSSFTGFKINRPHPVPESAHTPHARRDDLQT